MPARSADGALRGGQLEEPEPDYTRFMRDEDNEEAEAAVRRIMEVL